MSANSQIQGPPRWALLGAGGIALLLGGFVLLDPSGKSARAGEPSFHGDAFQTTDKLLLALTVTSGDDQKLSGDLVAELLDSSGKVIATKEQTIAQSEKTAAYRFEFPALKQKPEGLTLRYVLGKHKVEVPLAKSLLVKAHETVLSVGTEFHAGTTAALRCSVHGVKSLTETVPLPRSAIEVRLKGKDGKVHELFTGEADDKGAAAINLKVPALPAGAYKMEIATKSSLGEEKLERDIKLKAEPKVLLVSDKPLYQPGQLIHIRALCLGAFDLKPVADARLVFEVEDSKGNKVFKKEHTTTKHGVAAVDFQLASEVNQGEYKVRALLGEKTAEKTVTVKPYVLPKFKSNLTADKKFYAPRETVKGDLQIDYFFGKPVAGGNYTVTASTFDVAFKDFQTIKGKTDEQGHAKFEVKLPDYFVGQPLEKGNAIVKIEVKVTDKADHTETITKTYPVSNKPIQVSLIPEAGRLVPGVENRVFIAALYPDGSPAQCDVQLWINKDIKDKFLGKKKTSASGLAEFVFTPDRKLYRQGQQQQFDIEMLGGKQQIWGPKQIFDLKVIATDDKATKVEAVHELTSEPFGSDVMLRLDKAIYNGGDTLKLDVRSTAGTPTVYVDLVRDGQTLLTKWLEVKNSKASTSVDLPSEVFGTVEVHAYQMLSHGEIIRDSRVIYVQPAKELKVDVKADRGEYKPGEEGKITFKVTDSQGNPTAAALGVIIVDEAVYALQEMQPGLEKVYFTLQEELTKPQAQAMFKPSESIDGLVRQPVLNENQQQIAQALLCGVRPKVPAAWNVDPALGRKQKFDAVLATVGGLLFHEVVNGQKIVVVDPKSKQTRWGDDILGHFFERGWLDASQKVDPFGQPLTLERLAELDPDFTADNLARALTNYRMTYLHQWVVQFSNQEQAKLLKDGKWSFPDNWLDEQVKRQGLNGWNVDAWGNPVKLVKRDQKKEDTHSHFHFHDLVSAGPDAKSGTADDFRFGDAVKWKYQDHVWGWRGGRRLREWDRRELFFEQTKARDFAKGMAPGLGGAPGGLGGGAPLPLTAPRPDTKEAKNEGLPTGKATSGADPGKSEASGGAPPMRLREYFPETMLWRPSLVTDEKGMATLPLCFADSITTWRLTASASSAGGLLGGTSAPLRVFQDFFVDLDLPVALTKNDEVSFPVAVYNYLKTPQTVNLELVLEPWFELMDGKATRSLELKEGEVTGVKFRIRAKKVGHFPLQVNARGSKMSDAIKRLIEVSPDGQMKEIVRTDRLGGKVTQSILIPDNAIPDASKVFVKVYPGVFSQVLEGADGMLRMPGGCFEQTSSSAYPNVLAVDYIKKMKLNTPAVLMKAEQYLNVGYQRLLTFERPGGGFDWWGSGEPLIWLSAYGLQEFNDMAKVWPVDRGIIDRTQKWLMRQMAPDGTWSKIGATHGESIERMGDPKLLLTSYVVCALCDSGMKGSKDLDKSIAFIRSEVKKANNAYILALAANALSTWDANDDSTLEVLQKLAKLKQDLPEQKALCFPAAGQSLAYARGDSMTVETTALTALAMLRTKQFVNDANKALMYLVKAKDPHGTWGSTQATILALKALVAGAASTSQQETAKFAILVNGKKVHEGEVTEKNSDVLQLFDLKQDTQVGKNDVTIEVDGETNMMYQVVGRYFEPWTTQEPKKPILDVSVAYDRTSLSTADLLKARATLKYNGEVPTYQVIVDLGIPPGFKVDAGDFAEMVASQTVQRFDVTARQVILYIGDVKPGDVLTFEYGLKPKYPVKAKTPAAVAYEYYTPKNRVESKPVELTVTDKQ